MKKVLLLIALLVAGLGVGVGAAYGMSIVLGPSAPPPPPPDKPMFVPTGKILAPLVGADGQLSGYEAFEVELHVSDGNAETVTAKLPLLLHAINMRTYRTPMASGPDGLIPNLETFRKVVEQASVDAFGANVVKRAAITSAVPA